jgi:hypothetical protein
MSIKVTVDRHGNAECDPDDYPVPRNSGTVNIFWRMDTAGYKVSGITGLTSSDFSVSKPSGGTGWKIQDKNKIAGPNTYNVQVESTATGEVTEHDPIIRNGGQD